MLKLLKINNIALVPTLQLWPYELRKSKTDEATMKKLYTVNAHDAATTRVLNRLWTRIKTGR